MDYNWEGKSIAVVDDEEINFILIKKQLEKTKANIFWLENGQEIVNYIVGGKEVDLILMDIRMPLMDGFEATKRIKKIRPEIPIIFQTAYIIGTEFDMIKNSQCDDFIIKPIDANKLIKLIDKHFE